MAPLERNFDGFWGKPTATIDWCEANYEVTYYVAEFWNTITNIGMIVPPLIGAIFAKCDGIEDRFFLCHLFLMIVGIGSWCFHGTLLYGMQLLDELPMIWGSAFLIYAFVEIDGPKNKKNNLLIWLLFLYCSVVTVVYLTIREPIFHECAYALMVFALVITSTRTAIKYDCSIALLLISSVTYGTGFLLWNIDNIYCSKLRLLRDSIGYPLKPLLQGHAWWHILTGTGAYLSLLFCIDARHRYLKDKTTLEMLMWICPMTRRRQRQFTHTARKEQ